MDMSDKYKTIKSVELKNNIIICDDRSSQRNTIDKNGNNDYQKTLVERQRDVCNNNDIEEKIKAIVNKYNVLCKKQTNQHRYKEIKDVNLLETTNKCSSDILGSGINSCLSLEGKYTSREKKSFKNQNIYDQIIKKKGSSMIGKVSCSDKTTYCRPVINYNQEFIYRTIEQNTRLKRAVHKLIMTHQKEKENISWDNYINNLKNKHGLRYNNLQIDMVQDQEHKNSEKIGDYPMKYYQSQLCQDLLRDLYETDSPMGNNVSQRYGVDTEVKLVDKYKFRTFDKISYCYPTCSQGRIIVLEREKQKIGKNSSKWNYISNSSRKDDNLTIPKSLRYNNGTRINKIFKNKSLNRIKSIFIQTDDLHLAPLSAHNKLCYRFKDKAVLANTESKNTNKLTYHTKNQKNLIKRKSVNNIENKLDTLIKSINSFIDEIKLNRISLVENSSKLTPYSCFNTIDAKKYKKQRNTNNLVTRKSSLYNNITFENNSVLFNKDLHGFDKNNLEKIEHILNINNNEFNDGITNENNELREDGSVEITFEVPTKDCSTEVSKSLSKQNSFSDNSKIYVKEEKTKQNNIIHSTAIAVNTDPLSFIALLKISSDTIKQLLSYVPNIDYYSYLSKLNQIPRLFLNNERHCDCYADERNRKKVSTNNRNCCNCKSIYDKAFDITGPFKCTFCGKSFTRAYCWELHHISCAKRLGKQHDNPSLMLLT